MTPPISASVLKSLQKASVAAMKATDALTTSPSQPPHPQQDLLPKQFQQFQDRAYWDAFFRERKQEAFEWYGTYEELRPFVAKAVEGSKGKQRERMLVIGCGNSDFSTELYCKGGYHRVTNVDFSAPVIEEMQRKTQELCPEMEWKVMDVTTMSKALGTASFDVVLDKGTLDAIFSTPESERHADLMLDEVGHVLSPISGRYMVVTLGQDFILRKLLQRFGAEGGGGWCLALHAVEDPMAVSPFLTLVGIALRVGVSKESDERKSISVYFDASGRRLLDKDAKHFAPGDHADVLSLVTMAQERAATKHELRQIAPGRFKEEINIWIARQAEQGAEEEAAAAKSPRYTLSIVDLIPPTSMPLPCAVLIIPQGQEHDWLFSTADGLRQVGQSAVYQRLICVRMNRGHQFKDMEEVKAELGPVVVDFVPVDRDPAYLVPFLAVGESIGSRSAVVASGDLPDCGRYCVEEEDDDEDRKDRGAVLRRLVFYRNQHVIQSEVRLVPSATSSYSSSSSSKKNKSSGKKKGKNGTSKKKADHAQEVAEQQNCNTTTRSLVVDWSYLSFDYHRAILAGLIALTYPSLRRALKANEQRRCLVIGLGGGGLPLFVRRYVPCMDVTVVELEGGLAAVAQKWFGFTPRPEEGLHVDIGNGLERVLLKKKQEDGAEEIEKWDSIIVDVDNADASLGVSCPAPAFLTPDFLEACRKRLTDDGGVLIMNIAARSSELLGGAMEEVGKVFVGGEVHETRPTEQDVNRVVFALKTPRTASACKMSLGLQAERWLEECFPGTKKVDPLGLCEMPILKRA
ncbi:hypothetical protein VYU27_001841 [Nannochloropsis oceanica]